jgi:hypothetical protein
VDLNGDLISTKSGIILHPLGDRTQRAVAAPPLGLHAELPHRAPINQRTE